MISSAQRTLILDALTKNRTHPTAGELYAAMYAQDPACVSLATVYRNLNQLAEAGVIARIPIPGEADRFDPVADGHLHMACARCGTIVDVPASALPDVCAPASAATGCDVTGCSIIFHGLCAACKGLH